MSKRIVVGILADTANGFHEDTRMGFLGGAEYSQATLLNERPDDIDIVYCPPDKKPTVANYDAFLLFNCTRYDSRWTRILKERPFAKRIADWWRYGDPVLRRFILDETRLLYFSSYVHKRHFDYANRLPASSIADMRAVKIVPPPMKLQPFLDAARNTQPGSRAGALWAGRICPPKGLQRSIDYALIYGFPLDVYGFRHSEDIDFESLQNMTVSQARLLLEDFLGALSEKEFADMPLISYKGVYRYADAPHVFSQYRNFLYHPFWIEPFGRTVIEAYMAGCEMNCDWSKLGCREIMVPTARNSLSARGFAEPASIIEIMNAAPGKFWGAFLEAIQ